MPEITVLMAVRNGEPYVKVAIESILRQTYSDFAFLVVDDGSTDRTAEIVRSYDDQRVRLCSLKTNIGQTAALNRGLGEIDTEWVARMDADDYSAPERLQEQMNATRRNRRLGCIGTFAWFFRENPEAKDDVLTRPVGVGAIKSALLWSAPIIHGSILVRTQTMREAGGYNERYRYSADLDLYDRLLSRCEGDNIPEPLLGIRRHPGQNSYSTKALQESIEIFDRRLSGGKYSPSETAIVRAGKHLHEALCARMESRHADVFRHIGRAFWFAPALTLSHFLPRRFRTA